MQWYNIKEWGVSDFNRNLRQSVFTEEVVKV